MSQLPEEASCKVQSQKPVNKGNLPSEEVWKGFFLLCHCKCFPVSPPVRGFNALIRAGQTSDMEVLLYSYVRGFLSFRICNHTFIITIDGYRSPYNWKHISRFFFFLQTIKSKH
ncbi:unnamed protein product [Pipistrellus nathusii]|uniref:LAGLIDADG homing endonuclease n=1 Tax=Pipistrellus nathusii TaxID=59473 RepID=A0ABN9ZVD6_PIPNA